MTRKHKFFLYACGLLKVDEKPYSSPRKWIFTKKIYKSIVYSHCPQIFRAVYPVHAKVIV